MKRHTLQLAAVATLMSATTASGYEINAHALITEHAFRISVLNPENPNTVVSSIGFDRLDKDHPFAFIHQDFNAYDHKKILQHLQRRSRLADDA
jgi:hypothetical protein